jgi:predicted nucleic acid-binding Zn ribbon protein
LNCEEPIPEDRDYCSEQCMVESKVKQKRGSRKMLLFYVVAAIALIAIWVFSFVKF